MKRVIVKSQIDGEFKGWNGNTEFKLTNGQVWKQVSYSYHCHYAYRPRVWIYENTDGYHLKVEGDDTIKVQRVR